MTFRVPSIRLCCRCRWFRAPALGAGVVVTITLQQIDSAPHAEASAEGNHKGLQSGDGRSEKLHIFLRFSGGEAPAMKKAARVNGRVDQDTEDYITQTLLTAIFKFRFGR